MSAKIAGRVFAVVLCLFAAPSFALDEEKFFTTPPSAWEQFAVSPTAFQKEAEDVAKGERWWMQAQHLWFRRLNLLEPTPLGVARSGIDAGLDLAFRFSDKDETKEKVRRERFRLAKERFLQRQLITFFPDSPEAKQAAAHIWELNVRLQELDAKLGSRGLDETLFIRPAPRTVVWVAFGDRPLRDLASLGTAAVFTWPVGPIMGGVFWTISAGQRGWALYDHGGLTPEEQNRLAEFLAAEIRVLPHEKKQEAEEALLALYEQQGTIGSLAKAVDRYAVLARENPDSAEYHDKLKKTRERFADALLSYAEEKGDAATYYMLSGEFSDTPAGIKAGEQIEKKGIPKPQSSKQREAHINAGAGGSGFDVSGGGCAGGSCLNAGIMNMRDPYGEAIMPWHIPGIKWGTPVISGGFGRLSLSIMPDKYSVPPDAKLFE